MGKVTIEHDEWGRVEGVVRRQYSDIWDKESNGATLLYSRKGGWREVPKTKWVTYARQELKDNEVWRFLSVWFEGEMDTRRFELPKGYRWKTVEIEKEVNY